MILTSVELTDFRNYESVKVDFAPRKNYIIGKNAQGKTNLLEAIYLLCLAKSFRTSHEKEIIKFSKQSCTLTGEFNLDKGSVQKVIYHCSLDKGKQIVVNRKRLHKISEFIGTFPVVLSSPEEYRLTTGPPPERRKFVDILLSQVNKKYIYNLIEYQRIVKQKNAILLKWKLNGAQQPAILDPWNERLVEIGSKIIRYRHQFAKHLCVSIGEIYSRLIVTNEKLKFEYKPNVDFSHSDTIEESFKNKLKLLIHKEIQRGVSLAGPHRDDFVFKINDHDIKKFGSRGQHKTVLISLAIAEFNLIKEQRDETPVILIDDLYSELDEDRENKIQELLDEMGQVFITTTDFRSEKLINNKDNKCFFIDNGTIQTK